MKLIVLDRDGVINKEVSYLHKIDDFKFIDGIFDACLYFQKLSFEIIIITNQSGIARGYFTKDEYQLITEWMLERFINKGIKILDIFHSPHGPDSICECRKPQPGMFLKALKKHNIDIFEGATEHLLGTILLSYWCPACEYYALEGLSALLNTIQRISQTLNPALTVEGILRTMYDPRNSLTNDVSNQLHSHFGEKVYRTVIPRNVRLAEAPSHGLPAIHYVKYSRGAKAYMALAGEIIRREEKRVNAAHEQKWR